MCAISSMSVAGMFASLGSTIGGGAAAGSAAAGTGAALTSAASSTMIVGATTAAANAALEAAAGAGIAAATGGNAGKAALIGAGTGGIASVGTMALGGVSTVSEIGTAGRVFSKTPGLLSGATQTIQTGDKTLTLVEEGGNLVPETAGSLNSGSASSTAAEEGSFKLTSEDKAKLIEKAGGALGQTVQAGVSGYGQVEQAKLNQKALDDQAKMEKIRAQQALDRAAVEKMDNARKTRQLIGKGKVAAAANGIMLESRAESLASMWEQDANAELAYDNAKIDYNAQLEAWGYRENARRLRQQGRLGVRTARRGAVAGTLTSAGIGLGNVALSGFTIGMKNGWWNSTAAMAKSPASTSAVDWNIPGYHSRTSAMNFA